MLILPRASKYGNKRVEIDGYKFDSKKEGARYGQLLLLERCGALRHLVIHPRYRIVVNDVLICSYEADFSYEELQGGQWKYVVEDTKGVRTKEYLLKKKLLKATWGYDIRET